MSNSSPRILFFDLETGGVNAFKPDLGFILNFGYKWLGDKKARVVTVDEFPGWFSKKDGINDRPLVKAALALMEEADIIVGHYAERFDRKFFAARCLIHGFTPPPPVKLRDTWRVAKTQFNFSSNRLGHLAKVLKLSQQKYQKKDSEFPGWWIKAMAGNRQAIRAMGKYCKQDVLTLEALYLRLRPFDTAHPRLYDKPLCPTCGSDKIHFKGYQVSAEQKYHRFQCQDCAHWGKQSIKKSKR